MYLRVSSFAIIWLTNSIRLVMIPGVSVCPFTACRPAASVETTVLFKRYVTSVCVRRVLASDKSLGLLTLLGKEVVGSGHSSPSLELPPVPHRFGDVLRRCWWACTAMVGINALLLWKAEQCYVDIKTANQISGRWRLYHQTTIDGTTMLRHLVPLE